MDQLSDKKLSANQQRICILDYGDLKSIDSSSLLKQINERLSEIEFEIAIVNFSSRFTDAQRLTDHLSNSRYLEMITIGEPPLTLIFTATVWKKLQRFNESLPLPSALEEFATNAVALRQFQIVSLASMKSKRNEQYL